ncbi:MAG: S1C family serine protease [Phycisphaerae bacterium]
MFESAGKIRRIISRDRGLMPKPGRWMRRCLLTGALLAAGLFGYGVRAQAAPPSPAPRTPASHHQPRWIGVGLEEIPPVFEHLLGLKLGQGMLVVMVVDGSPAAKAGLVPGDLIIRVNGSRLISPMQLVAAANRRVDGKIQVCHLRVIRDGKTLTMQIRSQRRPNLESAHLRVVRLAAEPMNQAATHPPRMMIAARKMVENHNLAVAPAAAMPTMTLTRRMDIYGYQHLSIIYAGRRYTIAPSDLKTLPEPVRRMVHLLELHRLIEVKNPPTRAEKIKILRGRIRMMEAAEHQLEAALSRLIHKR